MNASVESYLACTVLLVTFALTLCQGQDCTLTARPHPQGICGDKLAQAHANLCFLLRRAFPEHFPSTKRSSSSSSLPTSYYPHSAGHRGVTGHPRVRRDQSVLERIYSIPMAVLARLNLNDENWRSFVYKRGDDGQSVSGDATDKFQYTMEDLEELPAGPTRTLIRMLSKRGSPIQKRSIGLVCECCFNMCRPRQLATYC